MSTQNLCFEQKYEKYQIFFYLKNFIFLVVKFSIYLNRHVFVMPTHSSSSKPRTAQMMILSLVAMTGLKKFCRTSAYAYLQWLLHSGERAVAHGPLV